MSRHLIFRDDDDYTLELERNVEDSIRLGLNDQADGTFAFDLDIDDVDDFIAELKRLQGGS
jgi:hypothetical protein